ncbi:MAG: glycosyltransferase family 2 protein [Alphaproteobacteria bacterium]|nr:glycosyltransferase family 2 protein [Alphaproteobacteria bacterium]
MRKLTCVVPCFNEQESIPLFYPEAVKYLRRIPDVSYEIVFVDDGSQDGTLAAIKKIAARDKRVRYVSFSRNFGKEAAIYAGLKAATGDLVVLMDADLQDPPALLPDMVHAIVHEGFDSVATKRKTRRGEPKIRSLCAECFYRLANRISKVKIEPGSRDYRMMTRPMVDAVLQVSEYNRFTKGIFPWVGFRTKWVAYDNVKRAAGKTKWNFWKLLAYSVEGIAAFSTAPLALASFLGVGMCVLSFLAMILIIVQHALGHQSAFGWASLVCIFLFVGGVQLFCIGILGQYLSRTYLETKKRPLYIVKERK